MNLKHVAIMGVMVVTGLAVGEVIIGNIATGLLIGILWGFAVLAIYDATQ